MTRPVIAVLQLPRVLTSVRLLGHWQREGRAPIRPHAGRLLPVEAHFRERPVWFTSWRTPLFRPGTSPDGERYLDGPMRVRREALPPMRSAGPPTHTDFYTR